MVYISSSVEPVSEIDDSSMPKINKLDPTASQALPLLEIQRIIPFDKIKVSDLEPTIDELILRSSNKIKAIIEVTEPRTFENTMMALEAITDELDYAYGIYDHLHDVDGNEEIKNGIVNVEERVTAFKSGIVLSEGLWNAVKEYSETEEAKSLTGIEKRFLDLTLKEFKREGANLSPTEKADLTAVNVELAKVTTKYKQNVVAATAAFEILIDDQSKLAGLPESVLAIAKQSAENKKLTGWRLTLEGPLVSGVLTYLDDASIREKMYREYNSRCAGGEFDNSELVPKILELRQKKAEILGYKNFAEFIMEERMIKNSDNAWKFENTLKSQVQAQFEAEKRELQEYRKKLEGENAPELKPWDVGYYGEKLRKELYDFDDEQLKPYFSYEKVLSGLFELTNKVFGITVKELDNYPVWHKDVKTFGVYHEDGTFLGCVYTDYFPREGQKRDGAWMNPLLNGELDKGEFKPHVALMAGNFSPPTESTPSLLTQREAETKFHEFGHVLSQLSCILRIKSMTGTNVPWDFVEFHSQVMENWCWEREALNMFARHYKDDRIIPDELFNKMVQAKNFHTGLVFMRQLSLGTLDLALHTKYNPEVDGNVIDYARNIMQEFASSKLEDDYSMITAFTHLFADPTGYAAAYYSYKWAEAIDADAFTRFQKEGIFNRETGRSLRDEIFAKGNSEDPKVLFENFMGRELDTKALLKRSGITV